MSAMASNRYAPSAFGSDVGRFWRLTYMLAVTEFKLRFFGSALGYVWSLMRPLMFFGVLYLIFTHVVRFGDAVEHYPVYLLTSIVLFTYFGEATAGCVESLVMRENLLRKIRFPHMVVPLSVVLSALFNLGMNLIAVLVFTLASGITPRLSWLEMVPLVSILVLFASGIGMLLSALYVRYRDVKPIWEVLSQILFYGSPVLYVVTQFPEGFQKIAMMNPIAVVLTQMRKAVLDPSAPSAADVMGGAVWLLIPLGIVVAVVALGVSYFKRQAPRIAENL